MKKSKFLILAAAIVLVAAACNKSTNSNTDTTSKDNGQVSQTPTPTPPESQTPSPSETPTPPPPATPSQTPAEQIISITSSGFSPNNVTIKSGTKVTFVNNDTKGHWPASNPHPVHTDYPGFDAKKSIAPGESYSFTFTKVGTWGYHDHLAPSVGGKITVTQ